MSHPSYSSPGSAVGRASSTPPPTPILRRVRAAGAPPFLATPDLAEGLALGTHAEVMRDGAFVRRDPRAGADPARYAAEHRNLRARAP